MNEVFSLATSQQQGHAGQQHTDDHQQPTQSGSSTLPTCAGGQ